MTTYNSLTVEDLIVKRLWVEHKRIDSIDLGALVVSDPLYNVGIGTATPQLRVDISGVDGIRIPVGNIAQRPTISDLSGVLRYNSEENYYESYVLKKWRAMGGSRLELNSKSTDNTTIPTLLLCKQGITSSELGASIEFRLEDTAFPDITASQVRIMVKNGGDSNKGNIHFQTANGTVLASDGTYYHDRMVIKEDGKVGIGISSPDKLLHLYDSTSVDVKFEHGTSESHYIKKDGNDLKFIGDDDTTTLFELRNNTNGNNVCSFPNGKLGIGKDAPDTMLHIYDGSETLNQTTLTLQKGVGATGYGSSTSGPVIEFKTYMLSTQTPYKQARIRGIDDESTNPDFGGLAFDYCASTSYAEGFRLSSNGNVGIGTDSPGSKLEIKEYLPFSSLSSSPIESQLVLKSSAHRGYIGSYYTGGSGAALAISSSDFYNDVDHPAYLLLNPTGGNVGIGTTSPNWPLHLYKSSGGADIAIQSDDSYAQLVLRSKNSQNCWINFNENLYLHSNVATRMKVPSGDNPVEINGRLQVNSNATNTACINLKNSRSGTAKYSFVFCDDNGYLQMYTDNDRPLILQSNGGNVGIGESNPHYPLTLSSNSTTYMPTSTNTTLQGDKMLWYGAGHFGGWNGRGGITIGRVTDTRSSSTKHYNCISSIWDSDVWPLAINPLGGNVGIGTNNPQYKLDIGGGNIINLLKLERSGSSNGSDCSIFFGCGNGWGNITSSKKLALKGGQNNSDAYTSPQLILDTNGNIGIGTSTPQYGPLHIYGSGSQQVMLESSNSWVELILYGHSDSYITYQNRLRFWRGDDVLVLGSNKYVGIGTNNPQQKLHVSGNMLIDGAIIIPWEGEIQVSTNLNNKKILKTGYDGAIGNYVDFTVAGNHSPNIDPILRLTHPGNVGIGTTNPNNKLDVAGGITGTSFAMGQIRIETNNEINTAASGQTLYIAHRHGANCYMCYTGGDLNVGGGASTYHRVVFKKSSSANSNNHIIMDRGDSYWSAFRSAHHWDSYYDSNKYTNNTDIGSKPNGYTLYLNYYSTGHVSLGYGGGNTYAWSYETFSDDRLKHNEEEITNGLNILINLKPVKYFRTKIAYKEDNNFEIDESGNYVKDNGEIVDGYIEAGLIAQELFGTELEYLVSEFDGIKDVSGNLSGEKLYTVGYTNLHAYQISAIKELNSIQQAEKTKLETTTQELNEAKAKIAELESTLASVLTRLNNLENN